MNTNYDPHNAESTTPENQSDRPVTSPDAAEDAGNESQPTTLDVQDSNPNPYRENDGESGYDSEDETKTGDEPKSTGAQSENDPEKLLAPKRRKTPAEKVEEIRNTIAAMKKSEAAFRVKARVVDRKDWNRRYVLIGKAFFEQARNIPPVEARRLEIRMIDLMNERDQEWYQDNPHTSFEETEDGVPSSNHAKTD